MGLRGNTHSVGIHEGVQVLITRLDNMPGKESEVGLLSPPSPALESCPLPLSLGLSPHRDTTKCPSLPFDLHPSHLNPERTSDGKKLCTSRSSGRGVLASYRCITNGHKQQLDNTHLLSHSFCRSRARMRLSCSSAPRFPKRLQPKCQLRPQSSPGSKGTESAPKFKRPRALLFTLSEPSPRASNRRLVCRKNILDLCGG